MTSSADIVARPSIDPTPWRSVGPLDVDALAKARLATINIVQWLARIANSFVAAGTAESRVLLEFRPADAAFVTKPFADNLTLELRLPTLEMQFHEAGKAVPHIFNPEERSPAEAEAWLLVELLHRGVDRAKFSKTLPYNVPGLMSGDAEDYSPQSCQQALAQLTAWFGNAAAVLAATPGRSVAGPVDIVCWPQTLNLSPVSKIGSALADYGFTPGDGQIAEPYFYRNLPATNGSAAAKTRSVLTASQLLAETDPAAAAIAFIKAATG
jgi:hypothetical protein